MSKRKKPKFTIGDKVVIILYGIVGEITDIKETEQTFAYEIDTSENYFIESSILLLEEFNGKLLDQEHINIDYKYFFGDLVQVNGYGSDIFKVIGFRTEIWRYKDESWEDVIYELSRIKDGEWLECGEDDLVLLADAKDAQKFMEKFGIISLSGKVKNKETDKKKKTVLRESEKVFDPHKHGEMIDQLLDAYNDYRLLKTFFGDEEYEKVIRIVLRKLKALTGEKSINTDS